MIVNVKSDSLKHQILDIMINCSTPLSKEQILSCLPKKSRQTAIKWLYELRAKGVLITYPIDLQEPKNKKKCWWLLNESIKVKVIYPWKHCRRCGSDVAPGHSRCGACLHYRKRNGIERPRHFFDRFATCKNSSCGVPLNAFSSPYSNVENAGVRSGYCGRCQEYKLDTGIYPVYEDTIWCECGEPAIGEFTLSIGRLVIRSDNGGKIAEDQFTLWLCSDCAEDI